MLVKIVASIDPGAVNTDGYNVHDYFNISLSANFGTREEAQEAAESGYKGPDIDGVICRLREVHQ